MSNIKVFENKKVRTEWDAEKEDWLFSVADVCNILADSQAKDKNAYWRNLKLRLKKEGSEVVSNCRELKLIVEDGKKYKTDVMYTKDILRIVQSIPVKNLKNWGYMDQHLNSLKRLKEKI